MKYWHLLKFWYEYILYYYESIYFLYVYIQKKFYPESPVSGQLEGYVFVVKTSQSGVS